MTCLISQGQKWHSKSLIPAAGLRAAHNLNRLLSPIRRRLQPEPSWNKSMAILGFEKITF